MAQQKMRIRDAQWADVPDVGMREESAIAFPERRVQWTIALGEQMPGEHPTGSRMPSFRRAAMWAGRTILGGYFIYNAFNHFRHRPMLAEYARSKSVPAAETAVAGSGIMLFVGGLSLMTGFRPEIGAGLITAFLASVSPTMHDFWNQKDPHQRQADMVNFTKNMALVGAALLAAAEPCAARA